MNAQNVYLTQENPGTTLNEVEIVGSSGKANLWIDNLNIENIVEKNIIHFQGSENYLSVKGSNNLTLSNYNKAAIYSGNELTVVGDGDLKIMHRSGAGVGSNNYRGDISVGNITIAGNVNIVTSVIGNGSEGGAGIGSGSGGTAGNITIGDYAVVDASTYALVNPITGGSYSVGGGGAAIGSGGGGVAGTIMIGDNAKVTTVALYGAAIGSGNANASATSYVGNIYNRL